MFPKGSQFTPLGASGVNAKLVALLPVEGAGAIASPLELPTILQTLAGPAIKFKKRNATFPVQVGFFLRSIFLKEMFHCRVIL